MSFRYLKNGDIVAIIRGNPPIPPNGYIQDNKNKYLYHPILTSCEYRIYKQKKKNCCNKYEIKLYCTNNLEFITQKDCLKCNYQKK